MVETAGVVLTCFALNVSSLVLCNISYLEVKAPHSAHRSPNPNKRFLRNTIYQNRDCINTVSILVETAGVEPASKTDKNKSLRVYSLFSRINQETTNPLIYSKSFKVIRTLTVILIRLPSLPYCVLHGGSLLIGKLD